MGSNPAGRTIFKKIIDAARRGIVHRRFEPTTDKQGVRQRRAATLIARQGDPGGARRAAPSNPAGRASSPAVYLLPVPARRQAGFFGRTRARRPRRIPQTAAGMRQGRRKQPVEQTMRGAAAIHPIAGPLQRRVSMSARLQRNRAAARFPKSEQPQSIVRFVFRHALPDGRAPKHGSVADGVDEIIVQDAVLARTKFRGRESMIVGDRRNAEELRRVQQSLSRRRRPARFIRVGILRGIRNQGLLARQRIAGRTKVNSTNPSSTRSRMPLPCTARSGGGESEYGSVCGMVDRG